MIELKNISKSYDKKKVLNKVSLQVPSGKCLGVIGKNGSGKSTLLKILIGVEQADDGCVYFNGKKNAYPMDVESKMQLGAFIDDTVLMQDLSGGEYLKFVTGLYGVDNANDKIMHLRDVLDFQNNSDFNDLMIEDYSLGMKKKIGIMSSMLHSPKYLILDEVFSSLDFQVVNSLVTHLKNLKSKTTIIVTSHVLSYIEALCDNIILIEGGIIMNEYDKHSYGYDKTENNQDLEGSL
jgi:ABC-2 type transport system ATP-binding protein